MTLCDTGPLVALIDRDDQHHARCAAALGGLPASPLVTTWPCLTEAMYRLGRAGGLPAQDELWRFLADGLVEVRAPDPGEWARLRELMHEYRDAPMDLADASLVVLAERSGVRRVFTVDRHFYGYRALGIEAFEVVP